MKLPDLPWTARSRGTSLNAGGAEPALPIKTSEWVTLDESYEICRLLNKRSGTTYYW